MNVFKAVNVKCRKAELSTKKKDKIAEDLKTGVGIGRNNKVVRVLKQVKKSNK